MNSSTVREKYVVISAALQLVALLPLFAIALSFGRMAEKIDAHEKRLDRIERKVLVQVKKINYDAGIFGTSFGVSQNKVSEVTSGQSVIFDMTLSSRDTLRERPTAYQSDFSCPHDNLTTVFWLKSLINPSG